MSSPGWCTLHNQAIGRTTGIDLTTTYLTLQLHMYKI